MSSVDTTKSPRRRHVNRDLAPSTLILGRSIEGRPIRAHRFHGGGDAILVLGGFHGDEPKSVYVAQRLIETLKHVSEQNLAHERCSPPRADPPLPSPLTKGGPRGVLRIAECANTLAGVSWVIIPIVNPDGYERRKRRNANGVDLNRNFPAENWELGDPRSRMFGGRRPGSEPETRAVIRAVERFAPRCIITIHSINRHRFCNNYDGPGKGIANAMHQINHYPVTASIGYATPGSFGTWAGVERGIATITLELPSHHSAKRCWSDNATAMVEAARVFARA